MIIYFIRNLNGALEGNIFKGSFIRASVIAYNKKTAL